MKSRKKTITLLIILITIVCLIIFVAFFYERYNIYKSFYLLGNKEITLEYGEKYEEDGLNYKTPKHNFKDFITITTNLDYNKIGNYIIEYKLDYKPLNIEKKIYRKITIVDTTAPDLNIDSEKTLYIHLNENFNLPNYTALDNYDGDITNHVKIKSNVNTTLEGKYKIDFEIEDSSQNKTTNSIDVIVEEKFKNTYIEISISKQKLTYYEKNKIMLTSDVVTGLNNWTPTGNFNVLNKARNTYLVGKNYRSFVRYWIAFKGTNYGMHDASWRSEFGGQIYKTNGSHGCVNMPIENASKLYELVEIGTPVYVKK